MPHPQGSLCCRSTLSVVSSKPQSTLQMTLLLEAPRAPSTQLLASFWLSRDRLRRSRKNVLRDLCPNFASNATRAQKKDYPDLLVLDSLHHQRLATLKTSAEETKCFICTVVWKSLSGEEQVLLIACEPWTEYLEHEHEPHYGKYAHIPDAIPDAIDAKMTRRKPAGDWELEICIRAPTLTATLR